MKSSTHRQTDEAKSTQAVQAQVTWREVEKGEGEVLQIEEAEETKYETDTG